jgi:hypothetical protein
MDPVSLECIMRAFKSSHSPRSTTTDPMRDLACWLGFDTPRKRQHEEVALQIDGSSPGGGAPSRFGGRDGRTHG